MSGEDLEVYYHSIIKDELNIKEIEFNANVSKYVSFNLKPNLPVLGKDYGRYIPIIREFLSKSNQMELSLKLKDGESIEIDLGDNKVSLNKDNVLITMDGLEGYAFSGEGTIGVVLDTTITDILREEGFVREIISKIQNLRKEKGFEVSDKINIYVKDSFNLINIINKYKEIIQRETLTINIYFNEDKLGLNYVDLNINKEALVLDVLRV